MQFRNDINGLRAIAVIAVMLFHFDASWMPGGFAGVDIFFVISGFLMTGIIFRGLEQQSFSIFQFYIARANRIIPALAVLCGIVVIFGYFYLTPDDYRALGKHAGSSMLFLSNVIYWKETGYFDAASQEKWLLHTWSLSVEWQFYVIYPLILIGMHQLMTIKAMKLVLVVGCFLGFILCVIMSYNWPSLAYYLLPARAWEMMVGGIAYLYPFKVRGLSKKLYEFIGIIFIFGSFFLISKDNPWPGYLGIFPVLGCFLVIQAQHNDSFITNNSVFQKLGTWSYSIYLWHWPIVVAIYYFSLDSVFIYPGIALSILLGFLSNKYIEKIKFRQDLDNLFACLKCKPLYISILISLLGSYVFLVEGKNYVEYMYPDNAIKVHYLKEKIVMPHRAIGFCFYSFNDDEKIKIDYKIGTHCILGNKNNKPDTLVFGDSFAGTYDPLLDKVFKGYNMSFNSISTNWCAPSFNNNFTGPKKHISYKQCLLNRQYLSKAITDKKYKNIILAASWNDVTNKGYLQDAKDVIRKAQDNGINVFIMPTPLAYKKNPLSKFYRQLYKSHKINIESDILEDDLNNKANDILFNYAQKYQNVYFIKRSCLFNKDGLFGYQGVKIPYSLDGKHISLIGSLFSEKTFEASSCYEPFKKIILNAKYPQTSTIPQSAARTL